MIRALVKAHRCRRRIETGKAKSTTDLAAQEGVTNAYVCRLLPLTCLAPDVAEAILDGRQAKGLKLATLLRGIPLQWDEQRQSVGAEMCAERVKCWLQLFPTSVASPRKLA